LKCYVWNSKAYTLALTLLNFQGSSTKPTNNNSTRASWPTSQLLHTTNGSGCYIHLLKGGRPRQLTTYMWRISRTTPPRAHAATPHICGGCTGPPLHRPTPITSIPQASYPFPFDRGGGVSQNRKNSAKVDAPNTIYNITRPKSAYMVQLRTWNGPAYA
jgi:hypothetical protein